MNSGTTTRPNRKTFVLAGNWAYSNRGCEAIVRGTTSVLRQAAGECRFISNYFREETCTDAQRETAPDIVHRPFPYLKRYSLPWIREQIARKVFRRPISGGVVRALERSLREANAVLMLGGDTFTPDYGNADVYFGLSSLAVAHKLPVAIWGASIGPFTADPDFERWAAARLAEISLLCVRETETLAYLAGLGLKDNVVLAADPAFHLQPSACELPAEIETALNDGCIGLNLSPFLHWHTHRGQFASFEESLAVWVRAAAAIVRGLLRRFPEPVLLIPHVRSEMGSQWRDDYLFLRRVAQEVRESEGVLMADPDLNAAQSKWLLGRVRLFAGARTHATLAAISSNVPTLCIGYSLKARGIAQDVYGHLDWLVRGEELDDPSALCDRLVSLGEQEEAIRSHLERVNPEFRRRVRAAAQRFVELTRNVVG
jgi:polysaccharide pyruvyl transferase WcaK-like protein